MVGIAMLTAGTTAQVSPTFSWVSVLEALAALVTVLGAILFLWRQTKDQRERNERFDRDWYGEPERPGVGARPGVLEQLSTVRIEVGEIRAEVFPNHGSSIKDQVGRMDLRLEAVEIDVHGLHDRLDKKAPDAQVNVQGGPNVHP